MSGAGREYWFEEGCWITELSNSDADPALSIARARVQSGGTTRWHRLHGVVERYLVLEGRGMAEVGDAEPRELVAGDTLLIPAGVSQRIHNPGAGDLVFLALCTPRFTPDCYEDIEST